MNQDFYYEDEEIPSKLKSGLAVSAFVISILSICCCFGFLSPVSLVLAVVALAKKQGGKVFSVIAVIISSLSLIYTAVVCTFAWKILPDVNYFADNSEAIIQEYEQTGKAPDYFSKYRDPKYDKYWEAMKVKDFDEFFGVMIDQYKQQKKQYENSSEKREQESEDDDGETLVDLSYTGAMYGMKFLATM